MDFDQMLPVLQSQAARICNGDKDRMQDALAMTYLNYSNCLAKKNHQLSIGELINFLKYRATELNNGTRPHFGNTSNKRTNDVYFKQAYLDDEVERLSFDYADGENEENDQGSLAYQTRIPSSEDDILYKIDIMRFRKKLNGLEREIMDWLTYGSNPMEISRIMQLTYNDVRKQLKLIGIKYEDYFQ